ncbi:GNAT family N-acetyltransferase [Roseovarius atlanticus]|uniref:GNAT family N-acetyltransferase n=1 Tax=Roseovarius atlanticus TaxID=1641875 RepID=UPI001C977D6A|nr:GNAT family N-acetyltransferase [Roseovarius atlanticus]MBY5988884.1 GNAT family N-acetyltransferase [Roseovarius atlanticus]MBY6124275.1 GNAT family N-acetyltransferase [Roseovarius atlanticus]MBY6148770.1 GNAT family N-acetyltransferase [Roseovarius atlanticus]
MTKLTLAALEDLDRLLPLVAAFHAEEGIAQDEATRRAALTPLLEGSPHGCVYLAGPRRAPIGYVIVTFGWSVEFGGLDGFVDEIFIRPGVRGRGIGSEILLTLPKTLAKAGMKAIHLEVDRGNESARRVYEKLRFESRENYMLMTRKL